MTTSSAAGRETAQAITVQTLTCAVAAVVEGAHADAVALLLTAAEGAIEMGDRQLAIDIMRQAQREAHKCTSR